MTSPTEFTTERPRGAPRRRVDRAPDALEMRVSATRRRRASAASYEEPRWTGVGLLGAGLALGVALGAGIALLLAPQSGEETREMLGDSARRLGGRMADRLDDLRGDLHRGTRRSRRKLRRGMTRGRWKVEDLMRLA
jgi:hypothetical protein